MGKISHFDSFSALAITILGFVCAVTGSDGGDSIHDLLREHGLPGGLLPKSVANFTLDEASGLLSVWLSKPCYAMYNDDLAFFEPVVRGNLSYGALHGVEGLSQEELFVWLPVKGILVADPSSGVILFDIGLAHKRLSRSLFDDPPECQSETELALRLPGAAGLLGRRGGLMEQRRGKE